MEYAFHLAFVKNIATDDDAIVAGTKIEIELPKKYMAIQSIVEFNSFTATHGPGTSVDGKLANKVIPNKTFIGNIVIFVFFTQQYHQINVVWVVAKGQPQNNLGQHIQHILYLNWLM